MPTRDLVYIALFAAITGALGLLPPITLGFIPVPITAQTLGVMLAGSVLGARRGGLSQLVLVLLVAAGLPLLSGWRGGISVLVGPSGGFLLAWPFAAFMIGWMVERSWSQLGWFRMFAFNILGGIGVIYLFGVPWLSIVAEMSLAQAMAASMAFIPGDLIKAGLAATIAVTLKRGYPLIAR